MYEKYVKKINGYDLIDGQIRKVTGSINSLVLDTEGQPSSNYIDIDLPTGWNIDNLFIIGGYFKLINTNDDLVMMRRINSETYDISTGDVNSKCEVDYYNDTTSKIAASFDNYVSAWVDYKVEFTILIYNKP